MWAESLAGIEHFKNLTTLYCNGPYLKSIDVSKNTKLQDLQCTKAQNLTTLISDCPNLSYLWCSDNPSAELNITGNNKLLQTLDVSNNPNLQSFSCNDNQLKEIDVSGCL